MNKIRCGFLIILIIVFLLNSILGCKTHTEDDSGTVDFPSSTAETIQTISEDTQLSDEKFIFDYESLSPYGQKKVKEDIPCLKTHLNGKPKDGYIFVDITLYYPDFDVEAEADKQLQTYYPDLYNAIYDTSKNESDLVVYEAWRKRGELFESIIDSINRPIVLQYCVEEDIKRANNHTYGIITEIGNIYSIIENKAVESVGFENEQSYFGNPELDFDDDDLKKLLPDTQPFTFQPWKLTAHALNKISPRLYNKLKQINPAKKEPIYIVISFIDNSDAQKLVMSQLQSQFPDLYTVYTSDNFKSSLYSDAIKKYSELKKKIYKEYNTDLALELCNKKNIDMISDFEAKCMLHIYPKSIYAVAENSNVKYLSYESYYDKQDTTRVDYSVD